MADVLILTTETGKKRRLDVEEIGGGAFSVGVRRMDKPHIVYILTGMKPDGTAYDRSKEVLAYAKSLRNSEHLPKLINRGKGLWYSEGALQGSYQVWETRYSHGFAHDGALPESLQRLTFASDKEEVTQETQSLKVPQSVKNALEDIFKAVEHFGLVSNTTSDDDKGTYRFDMHSGNFGRDPETGTVIFRDPLVCCF